MKVKAEYLLPLVLDFAKEFLSKDDFKVLKGSLEHEGLKTDFKDDVLVKAGGLTAILTCFLKHNKEVYSGFKKEHDLQDDEVKNGKQVGKKRAKKDDSSSEDDEDVKKTTKSKR